MKRVQGDLIALALSGHFDVIVHGCNCFHTMGGGIARLIKARFPEAFEADLATPKGKRSKLGSISAATITRGDVTFDIVNAYTQFSFGTQKRQVDYDAVSACFEKVAERFSSARIGYPLIGAGLAGGDWREIESRISDALDGLDHTLVELG